MASDTFLLLLGGLIVLAFLAEQGFARFGVPPVLVLIASGVILGPIGGFLPTARFFEVAPHFGALAFLLILFEGGLDLNIAAVLHRLRVGLVMAAVGFAVAATMAWAVAVAFGLPPVAAAVLAIVVAPISGAIVIPLAGRLGMREDIRTLVVLEAALADVMAVLAMGVVSQLLTAGGLAGLVALGSLLALVFSVLAAVTLGVVWPRVQRRLGEGRFADTLTFGVAMSLWGAMELIGASGALAVFAFAVTLANVEEFRAVFGSPPQLAPPPNPDALAGLHRFTVQLTFLVRTFFFVFLGVVVRVDELGWRRVALAVAVSALFLLGRKVVLEYVESRGAFALDRHDTRTLWLLQPRGLVSVVLAVEAAHLGVDDGSFVGVAFVVVLVTNLLLLFLGRRPAEGA